MEKRVSVRAIIFLGGEIVSMYRERDGRKFYTFPGGGKEEGETEQDCARREVLEEFGLVVEPVKKVYVYESDRSIEHFYVCKKVGGELGTGEGEEFRADRNRGLYLPTTIKISSIESLPLMPPEIAASLVNDYKKNGESLTDEVKKIEGYYRK